MLEVQARGVASDTGRATNFRVCRSLMRFQPLRASMAV